MAEEDRTTSDATQPAGQADTPPEGEHEFLLPGPTPTSNEGCFAWGASWVIVSLVLLVIVGLMTVACFAIALLLGLL